tara:strand:+ start:3684 stop:4304 length:621 start_codon:yes stop_codon:yes gene_type:complete
MNYIGEFALLAILIVVFYQRNNFLTSQLRHNRTTFLLIVIGLMLFLGSYHKYNMCYILAFIVVVLYSNTIEGMNKNITKIAEQGATNQEDYPEMGQEFKNEAAPGQVLNQTDEDFKKERKLKKDLAEEFSNLNPMKLSNMNMVDNDRTMKLNALKNSEVAKSNPNEVTNGVVNDVKDVLDRVKRLELLQEEAEAEEFEDEEEEEEF